MPTFTYQDPKFTAYITEQKYEKAPLPPHQCATFKVSETIISTGETRLIDIVATVEAYFKKVRKNSKTPMVALQTTLTYTAEKQIPDKLLATMDEYARDCVAESGKKQLPFATPMMVQKNGDKYKFVPSQ